LTSQVHIRKIAAQDKPVFQSETNTDKELQQVDITENKQINNGNFGRDNQNQFLSEEPSAEQTPPQVSMSGSQGRLKSLQSLPVDQHSSRRSKYAKSHISSAVVPQGSEQNIPQLSKRDDSQENTESV